MSSDRDEPISPDAVVQGGGLPDDPFAALGLGGPGAGGGDGLSALLGTDGGLDFGALMEQASDLQARMLAAQDELRSTEVEGTAGGGAVRITVTGGFEFRAVAIEASAVDPDDVDLLQDLVLAALNDAVGRIEELQGEAAGPGLGLGDLFGA